MPDRTFVIAEAGVNHNGSRELALQLIDVAADARADAVKFQTFKADRLATAKAGLAGYQAAHVKDAGTQQDMLRRLELSQADHDVLLERCKARGIYFMSTGFDVESLDFLATLGVPALKIASGDITCAPLLLRAARLRLPLIVSTGMSTLAEIEQALGVIAFGLTVERDPTGRADFESSFSSDDGKRALENHVTLLHCVTQYPALPEAVNLRAMDTMAAAFGLPVGYSDHTLGIEVAIAAVARGAKVIEKHFTLDRALPGPDHAASLEPRELGKMVAAIRNVERALGSPIKRAGLQEVGNRSGARRSVVAARTIRQGEIFTSEMLTTKRPDLGISPMDFWSLIGRVCPRDYETDEVIER